jgi:hypothetical protein
MWAIRLMALPVSGRPPPAILRAEVCATWGRKQLADSCLGHGHPSAQLGHGLSRSWWRIGCGNVRTSGDAGALAGRRQGHPSQATNGDELSRFPRDDVRQSCLGFQKADSLAHNRRSPTKRTADMLTRPSTSLGRSRPYSRGTASRCGPTGFEHVTFGSGGRGLVRPKPNPSDQLRQVRMVARVNTRRH